jgi:hypothetical protein
MAKLKVQTWKEQLEQDLANVKEAMIRVRDTMNQIDDIDEEFDVDEIGAYTVIKLKKMEKVIDQIFTHNEGGK